MEETNGATSTTSTSTPASTTKATMKVYKIVLLGQGGVGKSGEHQIIALVQGFLNINCTFLFHCFVLSIFVCIALLIIPITSFPQNVTFLSPGMCGNLNNIIQVIFVCHLNQVFFFLYLGENSRQ